MGFELILASFVIWVIQNQVWLDGVLNLPF